MARLKNKINIIKFGSVRKSFQKNPIASGIWLKYTLAAILTVLFFSKTKHSS
jgi:hypothetical protein